MNRDGIIAELDKHKDTFVEQYNAHKLKPGVSGAVLSQARRLDIVRNYYGLQYYSPDGKWSRAKWQPSAAERWFFFKHRLLSRLFGKSHVYSESDQRTLWKIRGGENYSFESETSESREFARRFFGELFKAIALPKDASIIELGCGSGRNLLILKEMGYTNLKGVDFSETQVAFCRDLGLDVSLMDISALGYPDRSFDLVFTNSVLLHVPPSRIEKVMRETVRVAKNIVALRENTSDEEEFSGHVYKYNYLKRFGDLGFEPVREGEFILLKVGSV
jgi:2-polyprenyl-3-methyl-5-hydroxy-6-metoxy-1,4-benzoquinol methylase